MIEKFFIKKSIVKFGIIKNRVKRYKNKIILWNLKLNFSVSYLRKKKVKKLIKIPHKIIIIEQKC